MRRRFSPARLRRRFHARGLERRSIEARTGTDVGPIGINSALMNRVLIVLGASLVILGLGWSWFRHVPLFRLPGDIVIDRPGFKFFLPITTMLLISAVISLVAWVLRR